MKLEIGYNHTFEIRKETIFAECKNNFRVLYFSDLHFNKYGGPICDRIIESIRVLNPDVILIGGDLVDSKKGLVYLDKLFSFLSRRENVFVIAGNHDYFFGIESIKDCVTKNNIFWLEKESTKITLKDSSVYISGNLQKSDEKEGDFSILFLHKPINVIKPQNYDLILAGHLHGCQFVFWKSGNALFPGKFFYKWNVLKKKIVNTSYFISKGLGDTLPIRYNCKRDMLLIDVTSKT